MSVPTAEVRGRGFDPGALSALFVLTLRQHYHGRRLLVLSLLFVLLTAIFTVANVAQTNPSPYGVAEFGLVFNVTPYLLALASLLYAAGLIGDEVEEQTLTYLLLRPLPRWALYVVKLLATLVVTGLLAAAFTSLGQVVTRLTAPEPPAEAFAWRALKASGVTALAQVAYGALFGAFGLLSRRAWLAGLAYIFLIEWLLAAFDIVLRQMTVMYYYRVLVLRWLDPGKAGEWSLDLATAPEASTCVLTLLGFGAAFAALAALLFTAREFRMKTPEGS